MGFLTACVGPTPHPNNPLDLHHRNSLLCRHLNTRPTAATSRLSRATLAAMHTARSHQPNTRSSACSVLLAPPLALPPPPLLPLLSPRCRPSTSSSTELSLLWACSFNAIADTRRASPVGAWLMGKEVPAGLHAHAHRQTCKREKDGRRERGAAMPKGGYQRVVRSPPRPTSTRRGMSARRPCRM